MGYNSHSVYLYANAEKKDVFRIRMTSALFTDTWYVNVSFISVILLHGQSLSPGTSFSWLLRHSHAEATESSPMERPNQYLFENVILPSPTYISVMVVTTTWWFSLWVLRYSHCAISYNQYINQQMHLTKNTFHDKHQTPMCFDTVVPSSGRLL